jgi:hypothetical protein
MKNKKYHTVGIIPKSNIKIVERGTIDTPNPFLPWHRHFNKKKSDGLKPVLLAQTFPLSEMMWSCEFFLHAYKTPTPTHNRVNSFITKNPIIVSIIIMIIHICNLFDIKKLSYVKY